MTYMQPTYYRLLAFDANQTQYAAKYGLMFYRDEHDPHPRLAQSNLRHIGERDWAIEKEAKWHPTGVPVLFIPGNAGSARQVRSIAKEASTYYHETVPREQGTRDQGSRPLDFFTVDLNEEFSAFHGHLLLDQAQYINQAIAFILSLYPESGQDGFPRPTSVVLVGHSMGGIVARTIFLQNNYQQGSVNTIVTVATPHMAAPISLDSQVTTIYARIEDFWRASYQRTDRGLLKDVSLVSIMGGNLDITVNSDSGNIQHIVPPSNGFSVFTSSIPHAWVGCDHLSILWCNQVAKAIGKAMVEIIDARLAGQVKQLDHRMSVFHKVLITGSKILRGAQADRPLSLDGLRHSFVNLDERWSLPSSNAEHYHVLELSDSKQSTLQILTDHSLEQGSRLEVLLCSQGTSELMRCGQDGLSFVPTPASTPSSSLPLFEGEYHTAKEFRFHQGALTSGTKDIAQHLVVVDRGPQYGDQGFLQVQIQRENSNSRFLQTTNTDLLLNGLRLTLEPQLSTVIELPNMDNSLLAYNLKASRPGCEGSRTHFTPFLRQSSWAMYEDKFSVNILAKPEGIDLNFHGDLPYLARAPLKNKKGVELTPWMDPTCDSPMTVELTVDKFGSVGKAVIRYRMAAIVFTFMVVLLTLRAQLQGWFKGESFASFGSTLVSLSKGTFWKFSGLLTGISVLQTLLATADSDGVLRRWRLQDVLLGSNDLFFWFLAPVFFQLAVGIVALVWVVLTGLVVSISWTMRSGALSRQWSPRNRTLSVVFLLSLIALVVPHPFIFTGSLLTLIFSSARVLSVAKRTESKSSKELWDRFHWMMTMVMVLFFLLPFAVPVLMVWIRNIAGRWFVSFPSDHRLVSIAPFLVLVEELIHGAVVPRKTIFARYSSKLTIWILNGMLGYLIWSGMRFNWQIYGMTHSFVLWILALLFQQTRYGLQLSRQFEIYIWRPVQQYLPDVVSRNERTEESKQD
ncbi:GPI inositol-deacylase [Entomortierella parvispora]|uniref:GPI inositol-deacylase n=1 Tax=Entomortierella parvispora TaxID=205924 RepID=A0A9P3H6Z3_9FUNG|nr:GPI inositol-deacylase [Entomortierella parvispora]